MQDSRQVRPVESDHHSRLLTRQNAILEEIAMGSPLEDILGDIVAMVEDQLPGGVASILRLDAKSGRLNLASGYRLPLEIQELCRDLPVGPNVGSCGRAAYLGAPVCVDDIEHSPSWVGYCDLVLKNGLRSCWSFPIFARKSSTDARELLGTFGIYFRDRRTPDPTTTDWLETAAYLTSIAIAADQTKQAQQERDDLQRMLQDAQAVAQIGCFEWCLGTNHLLWSAEMYRIFGLDRDSPITFDRFVAACHPEDRNQVATAMRTAVATGEAFVIQQRIVRPSGEVRTLQSRGRVLTDGEGAPLKVIGASQDVTEYSEADEKLRYTTTLLEKIVFGSSDLIFVKNLAGYYIFSNTAAASFVGLSPDKLVCLTDYDLFAESSAVVMRQQDQLVVSTGVGHTFETEIKHGDQVHTISSTKSPIRDKAGNVVGVFGISRDITLRKRTENELRRWNRGLQLLVEAATRFLPMRAPDSMRELVADIAHHLDCSIFVTFDFIDNELHLRESDGLPMEALQELQSLKPGEFPCGILATTRETMQFTRSELECEQRGRRLLDLGVRSIIGTPLIFGDQIFGTLSLCSTTKDCFEPSEVEYVKLVGLLATAARRREHAEHELIESERRFRELANAIPELVWIADAQGAVYDGNPLAKQVIGEFRHDVWLNAIHPDDRKAASEKWIDAVLMRNSYQQEVRIFNRLTGRYEWFLSQAIPAVSEGGTIRAWYGTAISIDEIKHAESALRDSETQLKAIFETSNAGLIEATTEGKILRVNGMLCRMFGRTADEIYQLNLLDLIYPEKSEEQLAQFRQLVEGWIPDFRMDQAFTLADGEVLHAHISLAVSRHENDMPLAITAVIVDVSTIKRLEEHVRQSQKMEAIGKLAGGVAHDFNNILTVIVSACELLKFQTRTQPELQSNISAIYDSAMRAAGLTKQLLAFSRKQILKSIVLNPNEMISRTEQLLRRAIGDEIILMLQLDSRVPQVLADPSQFQQVILNLAINARDAMPNGGTLCIQTRCSAGWGEPEQPARDYVEIIFRDTGVGIPANILPRIFEPFFSTKGVGKGTGLGLAVVHGIVEQSGGKVRAFSQEGHGTMIQILMPCTYSQPESPPDPASRGQVLPQGAGTVLVVDDESQVCKVAELALRSCGYHVLTACGPLQAIELIETGHHKIDVLLTDMAMPNMRGNVLAEILKRRLPDLKVAFMSGFTDQSEMPPMAEGCFLAKPFSPTDIANAIHQLLT